MWITWHVTLRVVNGSEKQLQSGTESRVTLPRVTSWVIPAENSGLMFLVSAIKENKEQNEFHVYVHTPDNIREDEVEVYTEYLTRRGWIVVDEI